MDIRQTLIEAYRLGIRFEVKGCGDPTCTNCGGEVLSVDAPGLGIDHPVVEAVMAHGREIMALVDAHPAGCA